MIFCFHHGLALFINLKYEKPALLLLSLLQALTQTLGIEAKKT